MTIRRFILFTIILGLIALTGLGAGASDVQAQISVENPDKEQPQDEVPELKNPNYTNSDYGFGIYVPSTYTTSSHKEGQTWVLEIAPDAEDTASARLSVEALPKDVTDVSGFWEALKDRDLKMKHNTTYEVETSVGETGAIQARVESVEGGAYILVILWVWVHNGKGYTLSGYPPMGGEPELARDLSLDLAQQFRWMTKEEIEAAQNAPQEEEPENTKPNVGQGREF
jgi:hypothetical protein